MNEKRADRLSSIAQKAISDINTIADNFKIKPKNNEERRRMIAYINEEMTDEE